ncbi:HEAT repeat domain-containing protein [Halobellus ordinarius]|uniref:HEAT repeat domain-containing protein n=1 Tax=Halobellus ordinarius TaxID=3075120 RepID=UPI00287FFAE8|nr:HEAT repeat domain-containing protein [Halobellus sp. ZY16]
MADVVSAFGYSVPLTVVVAVLALVIGIALAVMFWLTTGLSVYRSVQDTRRQRVRDDLQSRLLDGVFSPDPDWGPWVASLSSVERDVVEDLLDEYLRELDGENVKRLRELGAELGIPDRSKRHLETRGEYTRLYALTWLTLLSRPDKLHAADFTPGTPRERAAVARLRYESDDLDSAAEGVSIMLADATSQFSVFGQDTLYRIAIDDPGALFEVAQETYRNWSPSLLTQVLTVCQHLGTSITTEDLSWLIGTLEHENEAVRTAAARGLGNVGWRSDIRNDPLLERLLRDPSPKVRGAVYEMLARWGDQQALETLSAALVDEDNPRVRLVGTNALVTYVDSPPADAPPELENTWAWSREHAELDQVARHPGRRSVS